MPFPIAQALSQFDKEVRSLIPKDFPHASTLHVLVKILVSYEAIQNQGEEHRREIGGQALAAYLYQSFGNGVQNLATHFQNIDVSKELGEEGVTLKQCLVNRANSKKQPHTTWSGADRNSIAHLTSLEALECNLDNIEDCFRDKEFQNIGAAAKVCFEAVTQTSLPLLTLDWKAESFSFHLAPFAKIRSEQWRKTHLKESEWLPYSYFVDLEQTLEVLKNLPSTLSTQSNALEMLLVQMLGNQLHALRSANNGRFVGQLQDTASLIKSLRNEIAHSKHSFAFLEASYDHPALQPFTRETLLQNLSDFLPQWEKAETTGILNAVKDAMVASIPTEEKPSQSQPPRGKVRALSHKQKKKGKTSIANSRSSKFEWEQLIHKNSAETKKTVSATLKALSKYLVNDDPTQEEMANLITLLKAIPDDEINRVVYLKPINSKPTPKGITTEYAWEQAPNEYTIINLTTPKYVGEINTPISQLLGSVQNATLPMLIVLAQKGWHPSLFHPLYQHQATAKMSLQAIFISFLDDIKESSKRPPKQLAYFNAFSKIFCLYRYFDWNPAEEDLLANDEFVSIGASVLLEWNVFFWCLWKEMEAKDLLTPLCGMTALNFVLERLMVPTLEKAAKLQTPFELPIPIYPSTIQKTSVAGLMMLELAALSIFGRDHYAQGIRLGLEWFKPESFSYKDVVHKELEGLRDAIASEVTSEKERKFCTLLITKAISFLKVSPTLPSPKPETSHTQEVAKKTGELIERM